MLLALPNFGLERMGREKPQQPERFFAACGRIFFRFWVCTKRTKNRCRRSRCGFIRAYSTPKLSVIDRPARMARARIVAHDAPYDPWPQAMTVNEEIRAIQRNKLQEQFVTSRSDGPQGYRHGWLATKVEREDTFLASGAGGRSLAQAATQWQLNQPGRLAVSPLQLGFNKRNGQLPLRRQRRRIQPFEQIEQPLHIPRAA